MPEGCRPDFMAIMFAAGFELTYAVDATACRDPQRALQHLADARAEIAKAEAMLELLVPPDNVVPFAKKKKKRGAR